MAFKLRPSSSPSYYFDRSFSGKWWKQILWLAAAVGLTFLFFWSVSLYLFPNPEDFEVAGNQEPEGRLMLLFRLFYDPSSVEHLTPSAKSFGVVVALVGLVLFMGMLISVISNILERHIQRYMDGSFDYDFNKHDVILGYNKTVPGLIKTICRNIDANSSHFWGKPGILLLSEKTTDSIRKELYARLSPDEIKRVVIKSGNRNSVDVLRGLCLDQAYKVWVVGEENEYDHDSLNIDCVSKIAQMCYGYSRFKKGIAAIDKKISKYAEIEKKVKEDDTIPESKKKDVISKMKEEEGDIPYYYKEKLDVQVYLNKQSAFRAFQSTDMSASWRKVINFRASNFSDDWARYVLVNRGKSIKTNKKGLEEIQYRYPAIENPSGSKRVTFESDSYVHLVVFGMTDMGISMATRAAHMVHLPNFIRDKRLKTVISFIDLEADNKMKDFRNRFQYLFEIQSCTYQDLTLETPGKVILQPTVFTSEDADFLDVHFEFIKANASDYRVNEYLRECANKQKDILNIAICFNDPDYNLQIGQNLPHDVYFPSEGKQPVPVFIRQMTNGKLIDELRSAPKFKNLYPFGMLNESHVLSVEDELKAMRINFTYHQCTTKSYDVATDEDGYVLLANYSKLEDIKHRWHALQTSLQWSNFYCLDGFEIRRRNLGDDKNQFRNKYKFIHSNENGDYSDTDRILDKEIKILSEIEHNRWNVEKLLMGYRKPTAEELDRIRTDDSFKKKCKSDLFVHLDLQSYKQLWIVDEGAIKYDTIIMANIENIMKN